MDALAAAHDAAVQMIDTSIVRVHQHAATRYDKLAANYLAFIQLASIRLWLRVYEFTALDGIDTPSLSAQGEQRRSAYFNIDRDNFSGSSGRCLPKAERSSEE